MKRLFIALPIHDDTRAVIVRRILTDSAVRAMPVRWTPIQNLHLTLQFLGDVEERRIPRLRQIIDRCAITDDPESLRFTGIGCFPNAADPRILWLGIAANQPLQLLQRNLTNALADDGFTVDTKRFKAHLTLGRVKNGMSLSPDDMTRLKDHAQSVKVPDSPMGRVTLFESQLRPGGPIYTALYQKEIS